MNKRQKIRKGIILFSFFLFPAIFYYLSPVLIIQASSKGIINGSFVVFTLLFFSSLLLGRGYCGWLCPAFAHRLTSICYWEKILLPSFLLDGSFYDCRQKDTKLFQMGCP
jgi:polyferredoxin